MLIPVIISSSHIVVKPAIEVAKKAKEINAIKIHKRISIPPNCLLPSFSIFSCLTLNEGSVTSVITYLFLAKANKLIDIMKASNIITITKLLLLAIQ